ncbi:MAG: tetratricopeptide repeat protein [Phycisphaerae bacterium]
MSIRLRHGAMLLVCTAVLSVGPGCADMKPRKPEALRVEPPPPKPPMDPIEKRKRYAMAYERGLALADQREYGVAVGYLEQAVELSPDSTEALLALGACYEQMGDPLRAIRVYRQVLERDPDDIDALTNLGTSYVKLYHRERNKLWLQLARDTWRRALEVRPNQRDVQVFLAELEGRDP